MTGQKDITNVMLAFGSTNLKYHIFGSAADRLPREPEVVKQCDVDPAVGSQSPELPEMTASCRSPLGATTECPSQITQIKAINPSVAAELRHSVDSNGWCDAKVQPSRADQAKVELQEMFRLLVA